MNLANHIHSPSYLQSASSSNLSHLFQSYFFSVPAIFFSVFIIFYSPSYSLLFIYLIFLFKRSKSARFSCVQTSSTLHFQLFSSKQSYPQFYLLTLQINVPTSQLYNNFIQQVIHFIFFKVFLIYILRNKVDDDPKIIN